METKEKTPITVSECNKIVTKIRTDKKKYGKRTKYGFIVWSVLALLTIWNVWFFIPYLISGIVFIVCMKRFFAMVNAEIEMIQILPEGLSKKRTYEEVAKKLGLKV